MAFLFTIAVLCLSIACTLIMWGLGAEFYLIFIPVGTESGISHYSPLWVLAIELIALFSVYKKQVWGLLILFGLAVALPIDIYPAWKLLENVDMSLTFHIVHVILLWAVLISSLIARKYWTD